MSSIINRLFWFAVRILLKVRYRVTLDNVEQLKKLQGPILVLPNHPAYIDPAIILSHIRLHQPLRPLVFSGTYRMAMLRPLMSVAQAFEVPDLSAASRDAQTKTIEMIDAVVARLAAGDCILIYPSGRLQRVLIQRSSEPRELLTTLSLDHQKPRSFAFVLEAFGAAVLVVQKPGRFPVCLMSSDVRSDG